jgi:hypothetical protein
LQLEAISREYARNVAPSGSGSNLRRAIDERQFIEGPIAPGNTNYRSTALFTMILQIKKLF